MRDQCGRCFGFCGCSVTIFSAFRALPFFLVIMNSFHLRRCDPEFFPDKRFRHILHLGITIRTILIFFRQGDDFLMDWKISILVFTRCFRFACCPFVAFETGIMPKAVPDSSFFCLKIRQFPVQNQGFSVKSVMHIMMMSCSTIPGQRTP